MKFRNGDTLHKSNREMYEEQIHKLKDLKSSGASKEILKSAAENLKQLKAKLKKDSLQFLKVHEMEYYENIEKSWNSYPNPITVPTTRNPARLLFHVFLNSPSAELLFITTSKNITITRYSKKVLKFRVWKT